MSSKTNKVLNGQVIHNGKYPSSTHYDTHKFNTIENPMVTGGSPNNTLTLIKFEKAIKSKNPFNYKDRLYEDPLNKEYANIGPGLYSPQRGDEIGGSDLAQAKNRAMFNSTSISGVETNATKAKGIMLNSGSGASVSIVDHLGSLTRGQSFGSSA